jgi:hypothetical protein
MIVTSRCGIKAAAGVEAPTANTTDRFGRSIMSESQSSADARTVNPFTPLTIKGEVAVVHLTRGKFSVVDTADWPLTIGRKWSANPSGLTWYATRSSGRKKGLHQYLMPDAPKVDHKDRNGLNNRRSNLRPATYEQNAANRIPQRGHPGYRGESRSSSAPTASASLAAATLRGFKLVAHMTRSPVSTRENMRC